MSTPGRFFSPRDFKLIEHFNAEVLGDIIQTTVILFKVASSETKTNVYGESDPSSGKFFYPGIECTCHVDRGDITADDTDFGPDRQQVSIFKFREADLKLLNFYPEVGDIFEYNNQYFECDNVIQQQFLGSIPEKSISIICNAHYSRLSKLSLVNRQ